MPQFVVTRKTNNKEYFMENIYSDDKVIWVTDKRQALQFQNESLLVQFIKTEFPGKDYYVTRVDSDTWNSKIILKP